MLLALVTILVATACDTPPVVGSPASLVAGMSDTVIVNSRRPVQMPIRVLDANGHLLPPAGVRYQRTAGDQVPVTATGVVTCTQAGDATLRASLGSLATSFLVRCRPVQKLHIAGPVQFVLGDSAQDMSIEALGPDGHPVYMLRGSTNILDTSIASLDGLRLTPRSPGSTLATFRAGERSAAVGVHVYQGVATLDGLRPEQAYIALSLRLVSGEFRRWRLPPGEWMLTMLPYEDETRGLQLSVEGANCLPAPITRRRYVCLAKNHAWVIVYHPSIKPAPDLTGKLLLRRVNS